MTYAAATIRTWFDLHQSTIAPDALVDAAVRLKLNAIGVVDTASTLAHVPLAQAAQQANLHVAFGATLLMADGARLRLLARDATGYRSLCHLVSRQAHHGQPLPYRELRACNTGLVILCGGRAGRVWHAVATGDRDRATWELARFQALAEHDEWAIIECQQDPSDPSADGETLRRLLQLGAETGVRAMATHDTCALPGDEGNTLRLLRAIATHATFGSDDPALPGWQPGHVSRAALPLPDDWHRRWNGLEHLVATSAAVLAQCHVDLLGQRRFPGVSLPSTTIYDALWTRAFGGLRARYGEASRPLVERLFGEVNTVTELGVGAFLLHAADLVERAGQRGVRMVLQGSGTGSLLAYTLGISPVDPLRAAPHVFERFCGPHRGARDLPDLDFGVAAGREPEIWNLLIEMFGRERVSHLTAITTYGERGALRAAATAFGWDDEQLRVLRAKLHAGDSLDRRERMVVSAAAAIEGQPARLARHSSGVIVTDQPATEVYGLTVTPDGTAPMLMANRDDVEALQFLKFDILSWYALKIYEQAERSILADVYPRPELWYVPGDDPATAELLARGQTLPIPFLQSPACRSLLQGLRARTEADLTLVLGALRPGAAPTRQHLYAVSQGQPSALPGWETLSPGHQAQIAAVLAPSRGAVVFDDDALHVLHVLGLDLADAERFRKALVKGGDRLAAMRNHLYAAAITNGWQEQEIAAVLGWLDGVKSYIFCRGHSSALAAVAYRVARLLAHYPAHVLAAVFDCLVGDTGGMYPPLVYLSETRRLGLAIVPPHVNSTWESRACGTTIALGLSLLQRVINPQTVQAICTEARTRPFVSVADVVGRVACSAHELECLVACGALDQLALSRRHARWEIQAAQGRPRGQDTLFNDPYELPTGIEPEHPFERAEEEYAVLGLTWTVDHPLDLYRSNLEPWSVVTAEQITGQIDREVVVAGMIVARRRILTVTGQPMLFLTLCDRSGIVELTLFANILERVGHLDDRDEVVVASGIVRQDADRGIGIEVRTLHALAGASRATSR